MSSREMPYKWKKAASISQVELEAALGIPDEGRAAGAAILGECPHVPGGIGEFQDTREDPIANLHRRCPGCGHSVRRRTEHRKLPHGEVRQVKSADLLPCAIVKRNARKIGLEGSYELWCSRRHH